MLSKLNYLIVTYNVDVVYDIWCKMNVVKLINEVICHFVVSYTLSRLHGLFSKYMLHESYSTAQLIKTHVF